MVARIYVTAHDRQRANAVNRGQVEDLISERLNEIPGLIGDGIEDDTYALQMAGASGKLNLLPSGTFRVTSAIDIADGGGFVGPRSAVVYADPLAFNNTSLSILNRYGDNAVVFRAQGLLTGALTPLNRVTLSGFTIKCGEGDDTTDGRNINAVVAQNIKRLEIDDLEIWGMPHGVGIRASSIQGGFIRNCYLHDFWDNTAWGVGVLVQLTGIEFDNDVAVGLASSTDVKITDNHIQRIRVGSTFFSQGGYSTDGINIAGVPGQTGSGLVMSRNRISYVGEGIDCFASDCTIEGNIIDHAWVFGIKCIHSACRNNIGNNIVLDSGAAGIVIVGDTTEDSSDNIVNDNIVINVGDDTWTGFTDNHYVDLGTDTACIVTWPDLTTGKAKNTLIAHNRCDPGPLGKWGVYRGGVAPVTNHWMDNYVFSGLSGTNFHPHGELGAYSEVGAPLSLTQSLTIATTTQAAATLQFTDDGATGGFLLLNKESASPAVNDDLYAVLFRGRDSGGNMTNFAGVSATSSVVADGSEEGQINFIVSIAGAFGTKARVTKSGIQIISMPTSSAGLATGTLWNDTGTVKVA